MTQYVKDFIKDPEAVKDYTVDWTKWLVNDTIVGSTWELPDGIVKESDAIDAAGKKTVIWLSGGREYCDYDCYNVITTIGGRTERALARIEVR